MFINDLDAVVVASVCTNLTESNYQSKFTTANFCPIFRVSNVTGAGIDLLRTFLNILPFHGQYSVDKPAEFSINDTFSVPYTGAVAAGIVNSGTIHNGDTMWMVYILLASLICRVLIILMTLFR
jgi:GTPase